MLVLIFVFFFYCFFSFFINDTATTEIYTLSLHDALPICGPRGSGRAGGQAALCPHPATPRGRPAVPRRSCDAKRRGWLCLRGSAIESKFPGIRAAPPGRGRRPVRPEPAVRAGGRRRTSGPPGALAPC